VPEPVTAETLTAPTPVCERCEELDRFYAERGGALAWTGPGNVYAYHQLLEAIAAMESHGLDPELYGFATLVAASPVHADLALDEQATRAWLEMAHDLSGGRLDPRVYEPGWISPHEHPDPVARLNLALELDAVALSLAELAPNDDGYHRLREALRVYRALALEPQRHPVSPGPALHPGDAGPRVVQLRDRLEADGYLDGSHPVADRDVFDAALADAVVALQRAVHLDADGIVGEETLRWLSISAADRVAQIEANLERRRWRRTPSGRALRVNIPDFSLEVLEDGAIVDRHRVIVGRISRPTPVFAAELSYLILNPWWETPYSLAVRDELPAFRADPDMVARLGFQVLDENEQIVDTAQLDWNTVPSDPFPFRLRQAPGPDNALGEVKFIFPNPHNTYLHDTPARHLFDQSRRAYSSGCMRVEAPLDLARWVTEGLEGWTGQSVDAVAAGDEETRVDLTARIPVDVVYWTVIPSQGSWVRFVADLYEKDEAIINGLSGGSPNSQE